MSVKVGQVTQSELDMSVKVVVDRSGIDQLRPRLRQAMGSLVRDTADLAYHKMQGKAPEKTGKLKRSIHKRVNLPQLRGEVGPDVDYAVYVEYGTRPHTIRPVRARALRFESGEEIVFTRVVRHPGTEPQRFIQETAEEVRRELPGIWREKVEESFP